MSFEEVAALDDDGLVEVSLEGEAGKGAETGATATEADDGGLSGDSVTHGSPTGESQRGDTGGDKSNEEVVQGIVVPQSGSSAAKGVVTQVMPAAPKEAASSTPAGPTPAEIFTLARQQNFPVVGKLLGAYPQYWQCRDEDGHSYLHWAALVGNTDFTNFAVSSGIPVDAQAQNMQTALMWASLRGHVQTARVLLDLKADMRIQDSLGATALTIAVQHRCYQSMLLLLRRGGRALLSDTDKNGCTVVHWAAFKGDITALKFLEYFEADFHSLDNSRMTPLHRACLASQAQVIEFLVEQGLEPTQPNADGESCLDIASRDPSLQTAFRKAQKALGKKWGMDSGKEASNTLEDKETLEKRKKAGLAGMFQDKTMHKLFPCFWLVCVSVAVFQYLTDLRALSWTSAPTGALLFELGVPLSLFLFTYTALKDPGKVKPRPRGNSGVEEIMQALDSPDEVVVDMSRLCTSTWVLKGLRSKYCTQSKAVIEEFDHYCIWLNCAIGKNNHRTFVLLALAECFTQLSHLHMCWMISRELVSYTTFGNWFFMLLMTYPLLIIISLIHCLTAPWVFMLFVHQSRLAAMNLTTNEMMNAYRYEHFWVTTPVRPGQMQKQYRNPFSKGGPVSNCLDFWWFRRRAEMSAAPSCATGTAPCCAHGHHHQGHSHFGGGYGEV